MAKSLCQLGVQFPYFIAPMVGVSHVAFRELVRSYTPSPISPMLFTEMLSTRRIPNERLDLAESLFVAPGEGALIPQLLGNEEKFIETSIKKLEAIRPWGFDINMGCPTKKTIEHNWGVRLMGDKKYAAEVVSMARRHSNAPLSVKLRAGLGDKIDEDYLADFTDAIEAAGADWLTVHCRSQNQRHRGHAKYEVIANLKKRRSIPLVANGAIHTAEDAVKVKTEYGVDGVMIARAAIARPWILWQIQHLLEPGSVPVPPMTPEEEGREYFNAFQKFCDLCLQYFGESKKSLFRVRLYAGISQHWLPFGHTFWKKVNHAPTIQAAKEVGARFANEYPQTLYARVNL